MVIFLPMHQKMQLSVVAYAFSLVKKTLDIFWP